MSKNKRFGIVSHTVMTNPDLSLQAKAIYGILSTFANKDRLCYPSIGYLADLANVSCRTVDRKIQELKNKGCIKREGKQLRLL
jgi:hypothetical protein